MKKYKKATAAKKRKKLMAKHWKRVARLMKWR